MVNPCYSVILLSILEEERVEVPSGGGLSPIHGKINISSDNFEQAGKIGTMISKNLDRF